MTKRIKQNVSPTTRDDVAAMVETVTHESIQRDKLVAEMNEKLDAIRDEYKVKIDVIDARIKSYTGLLKKWAEGQKSVFGKRRSIELPHGRIGFRLGQWSVRYVTGVKIAEIIKRMKRFQWGRDCIKTKEEVDKQSLILRRDSIDHAKARECGIRFVQQETFFIEPKVDEVETITA